MMGVDYILFLGQTNLQTWIFGESFLHPIFRNQKSPLLKIPGCF